LTSTDGPAEATADPSTPSDVPVTTARGARRRRVLVEWLTIIVLAAAASLLLRAFVFQTFFIPSGSMNPTLWKGDRILVDKLSVRFGTINVGDIVVFKAPPAVRTNCSDAVADLVKRVIGVPGDRLTSKGNTIYVNGTALKERWSHYEPLGGAIGHVTVPSGDYFVMGDNHSDSCDSRSWGFVPRQNVIGKVFLVMWPFGHFRWI
jgi:signal peptidase I